MAGQPFVTPLLAELRARADERRAVAERAYLKSEREHWGVGVPAVRRAVRAALVASPIGDADELRQVCDELWSVDVHEARLAAVEVLRARSDLLGVVDLPWIEGLIRDGDTWAIVDELARHVVADIAVADPGALQVLDRWVADPSSFWVRRAAVLGLSKLLRQDREVDRFVAYADRLLPEREFFIRKVLGWVARELSRVRPDVVSAWLRRNLDAMNGVTLREAVKYLPDGDEITARYASRRNRPG